MKKDLIKNSSPHVEKIMAPIIDKMIDDFQNKVLFPALNKMSDQQLSTRFMSNTLVSFHFSAFLSTLVPTFADNFGDDSLLEPTCKQLCDSLYANLISKIKEYRTKMENEDE